MPAERPTRLRAGLYHRASTLDQDPALCRKQLRAAARVRGCQIVLDIEETGSGRRNDRPGLQRIMAAARRGALDIVMVWRLNRFGRSMMDLQTNLRELRRLGITFVATSQGIEIGAKPDAITNLLVSILSALAEFDSEQISEGTIIGMQKAAAEGRHVGRPRRRTIDVDQARRLLAGGASQRAVARSLGCPESSLRRVLKEVATHLDD